MAKHLWPILKKAFIVGGVLFSCQLLWTTRLAENRVCGWPMLMIMILMIAFPIFISSVSDPDYRANLKQQTRALLVSEDNHNGLLLILWLLMFVTFATVMGGFITLMDLGVL